MSLMAGIYLATQYMQSYKLDSKQEQLISTLYAWGYGNYGQLGLGNEQTKYRPEQVFSVDGNEVASLEARKSVSALITKDGKLYTWGKNRNGVMGMTQKDQNITLPSQVDSLDDVNIKQVSIGINHMLALDDQGNVYSWGNNQHGKLGHSFQTDSDKKASKTDYTTYKFLQEGVLPQKVENLPTDGKVVQIACGFQHSVLLTDKGDVYTFGNNQNGFLGQKTENKDNVKPVKVESLSHIKQIGAGLDFTLALNDKGQIFSWGNNIYGQLGNGTDIQSEVPCKVKCGMVKFESITCGDYYSAAVTKDGSIYNWGYGNDGQLCLKTREDVYIPSKINWDKKPDQISCGSGHVTIISGGQLYVFGRGREGQLGLGDTISSETTYRTEPKQVVFFKDGKVVTAKAGGEHTIALVQTKQKCM